MNQPRPQNHVTRELEARLAAATETTKAAEAPSFTEAQIAWMEGLYPPRCLSRTETAEEHLRYAGAVEFVQRLRDIHEDRKATAEESDRVDLLLAGLEDE